MASGSSGESGPGSSGTINLTDLVKKPKTNDFGLYNSETSSHPNNPAYGHRFLYHVAVCEECNANNPDAYDQAMLLAPNE